MARHKCVLSVCLVIGLLVSACGPRTGAPAPAPPPRPEGGSALAPGPSMEELYAAARPEGKVLIYSSLNLDDVAELFPLFESRFPGVKIEHTRATGERLLQRLVTEVRGGSVLADVFETNGFEIYNAAKEELTEPFCPANIADLNPNLYEKDCMWIGTRTNHDIVAWNTNLVRPGEEPKTYEDLGDPKWKDRILMELTDVEMFNALLSDRGYGEQRGMEMFRRIAANNPEFHSGHTEIADRPGRHREGRQEIGDFAQFTLVMGGDHQHAPGKPPREMPRHPYPATAWRCRAISSAMPSLASANRS